MTPHLRGPRPRPHRSWERGAQRGLVAKSLFHRRAPEDDDDDVAEEELVVRGEVMQLEAVLHRVS